MKLETKLAIAMVMSAIAITVLTGCASTHERTEIDRELVLKLADRPQVIVANPAPVNVNNYNGGYQAPVQASQQEQSGQTCTTTALYNLNGTFWKNDTRCW